MFTTHLECSATGERYPAGQRHGLSQKGKPLLVRYDLPAIARAVSKDDLAARPLVGQPGGLWRYREFLPVVGDENVVTLGELETPLIDAPRLAARLGGARFTIKDEGRLPTGSFKARGLALAVSMAKELGVSRMAMPTNGNAGAALAAYASRCGIEAFVFCPDDTPDVNVREIALQGAKVWKVNGLIHDCGKIVGEGTEPMDWFDTSTLKEPYRIEGKKTMGLELAEQLGWTLPDVIFYPTGGGTGLIGMWKGFKELQALGWITGPLPRMVAVQSTGCGPIVRAFEAGADEVAEPWPDPDTQVHGVRVPKPLGDRLILSAIRESVGFAVAVDDAAVTAARAEVARERGLHLCPEGAACYAACIQELESGRVGAGDRVVLFNTASGLKTPMPAFR